MQFMLHNTKKLEPKAQRPSFVLIWLIIKLVSCSGTVMSDSEMSHHCSYILENVGFLYKRG